MDDRNRGGNVPLSQEHGDLAASLAAEMVGKELGGAEILLVLGSGLGAFIDQVEDPRVCTFDELPNMPRSSVPGHSGRFVRGRVAGHEVLCQAGRVHLYEVDSPEVVTRAVRATALLGVPRVLLTNAAGGLERDWPVPSLMRATGHLNMTHQVAPGAAPEGGGSVYCAEMSKALVDGAAEAGVVIESGVYAGMVGPGYETAAEITWLAGLGANAVGMSTVLEADAAHGAGMGVGAVSCITNPAAGISMSALNHEEVVQAGALAAESFGALITAFVGNLPVDLLEG